VGLVLLSHLAVSGFSLLMIGLDVLMLGFGVLISCFGVLMLGFVLLMFGFWVLISGFVLLMFCIAVVMTGLAVQTFGFAILVSGIAGIITGLAVLVFGFEVLMSGLEFMMFGIPVLRSYLVISCLATLMFSRALSSINSFSNSDILILYLCSIALATALIPFCIKSLKKSECVFTAGLINLGADASDITERISKKISKVLL